jgi:purine-nucleoside phosphorylase
MFNSKVLEVIRSKTDKPFAEVGIILGSGLGSFIEEIQDKVIYSFEEIPGFPITTVEGHKSQLILGQINGVQIAVLQGRVHYYEDSNIDAMKIPLQTLKALGCSTIILTNSAGSLKPNAKPGEVILLTDHINYMGISPLFKEKGNARFVNMVDAYDPTLRDLFLKGAKQKNILLHEGVYFWFCGPNFETPAEIRGVKILGGDVVGMSTVPEVILARYLGLKVAALSVVTNMASGMDDQPLSHERTIENAKKGIFNLKKLLVNFLEAFSTN